MSIESPHQAVVNYNAGGHQDRLLLGIVLVVLGEGFLVLMGATIKQISTDMPLAQIMFFRNLFALTLVFLFALKGNAASLKTDVFNLHFMRGFIGIMAMTGMFYSFASLKLTEAVILKSTTPIFISFVAWLFLREKLSPLTWLAIFMAFIGVIVMVNPQQTEFTLRLGVIAGVSSAFLASLAKVFVRKLGRTEPSTVIVFYFAMFGALFTLPFAIWQWQPISTEQWGFLLLIGVFASFGQVFLTRAYTVAAAGKVGMFTYTSMPIAGFLGFLVWGETLDTPLIVGTLIIVFAGLLSYRVNSLRGSKSGPKKESEEPS